METERVLKTRRSIHNYADEAITDTILYELFERVRYTPSSYNLQPWKFLVLREEANKGCLWECTPEQEEVTEAAATVGVAIGAAGTDTALETADIALMGDDLSKLPYLYALSNKANGVIRENIWVSLGAKALLAVGVPLSYVSVALAVIVGDMGMSLGVTDNATRLSRFRPERFST